MVGRIYFIGTDYVLEKQQCCLKINMLQQLNEYLKGNQKSQNVHLKIGGFSLPCKT